MKINKQCQITIEKSSLSRTLIFVGRDSQSVAGFLSNRLISPELFPMLIVSSASYYAYVSVDQNLVKSLASVAYELNQSHQFYSIKKHKVVKKLILNQKINVM